MMMFEKALLVILIMRIVAAMMVILKRPLCSRPLMTSTETQPLGSERIVFELLTSCQQDSSRKKTEIITSSTYGSYHTSRNNNTNE